MSATDAPPSARSSAAPRILFFGMAGRFSALALEALLAAGLPVAAVATPGLPALAAAPIAPIAPPGRRALALAGDADDATILDLAAARGLPAYAVVDPAHPATLAALGRHAPDLIGVACYPRRLPAATLALARLGGLNAHPSLLPAGRGPAPRFWAFRHGLRRSGVSVHRMTQALDAGPIVAQAGFDLPDGLTGAEFDARAGMLGGRLLAEAALALTTGAARPAPQDERLATYDPWPTDTDYLIAPERPARWVYNIVRGVAGDGGPLAIRLDGRMLPVAGALAFDADGDLGRPWRIEGETIWLQCRPGVARLRLASSIAPPTA
jgi:methionyl-tRNA formyltransferase